MSANMTFGVGTSAHRPKYRRWLGLTKKAAKRKTLTALHFISSYYSTIQFALLFRHC